jgi:hypothetical protein
LKLTKAELLITNGACKESSRPVLTAMCLRNGILSCADGFLFVSIPARDKENLKDELYPVGMLNFSGEGHIKVERTAEGFQVKTYGKDGKEKEPARTYYTTVTGTFPDYGKLLPLDEPKAEICFSSGMLRKLLDCLPKNSTIHFGIHEKDTATEILVDDGEEFPIRGMIMPMLSQRLNTWAKDDERWVPKAPKEISLQEALGQVAGYHTELAPNIIGAAHGVPKTIHVGKLSGGTFCGAEADVLDTVLVDKAEQATCKICQNK